MAKVVIEINDITDGIELTAKSTPPFNNENLTEAQMAALTATDYLLKIMKKDYTASMSVNDGEMEKIY